MLKRPLVVAGLYLASCALTALLLWRIPPVAALASSFSAGALHAPEHSQQLGTYQWSGPRGALVVPLHWWADRVLVRQRLSAGPQERPLSLSSPQGELRFTLRAGDLRTYRYLAPTAGTRLELDYTLPPFGPSPQDPRELGMIIGGSRIEHVAGARWPTPALLALVLLVPLAERAGAAWGLAWPRWALALALTAAALVDYQADGLRALVLSQRLGLGLVWFAAGGWLLGRLWHPPDDLPGAALALSLGATLVPLLLIMLGLGGSLPGSWLLLAVPPLVALALTLIPGAARYRLPLAVVSAGCVLAWSGVYFYNDAIARSPSDFRAYYEAALRLRQGLPLYDLAALAADPFATSYKYPPLWALLVAPLTALPFPAAAVVWRTLCIGAAGAGALILAWQRPPDRRAALSVFALALIFGLSPVSRSLRFGQPELLIFAVVVAGTALLVRDRRWPSGALWSLIGIVKLYPLLLLPPLLLRGRWRWALTLAGGAIGWLSLSLALGGWQNELTYWRDLFPTLGARDGRLSNLSLFGVIARLLEPSAYAGGVIVPGAAVPALLLSASLLGGTLLLLWLRRARVAGALWDMLSLMLCAVLLVLPVSWDHYHALLLLPLLTSWAALCDDGAAPMLWLAAYTLLIFGVARDIWPSAGTTPGAFALLFASYRTCGLLLLWLWLARRLMHGGPTGGTDIPAGATAVAL